MVELSNFYVKEMNLNQADEIWDLAFFNETKKMVLKDRMPLPLNHSNYLPWIILLVQIIRFQ